MRMQYQDVLVLFDHRNALFLRCSSRIASDVIGIHEIQAPPATFQHCSYIKTNLIGGDEFGTPHLEIRRHLNVLFQVVTPSYSSIKISH